MPFNVVMKQKNFKSNLIPSQAPDYHQEYNVKFEGPSPDSNPGLYEQSDECDLKNSNQQVWLVRLPSCIREDWNHMLSNSDEEVVIGKVMINKKDRDRIKIFLSAQHAKPGAPRAYDLKAPSKQPKNTFVFTEKVPLKRKREKDDQLPETPSRLLNKRRIHVGGQEVRLIVTRQVIQNNPTAIVGTADTELVMHPVRSSDHVYVEQQRIIDAKRMNKETKYLDEPININMLVSNKTESTASKPFLKIAQPNDARSKKLDKAYRGSREIIQTKLFDLFKDYEYYPIKLLAEKTNQPEAYLREILEDIAQYTSRGTYAGKWSLKSEYKTKT